MGFFYHADRFPFVLSILTGFTFILKSIVEWRKKGNVITARPVTEIATLSAMSFAWTVSNAFSTPRWNGIQPGVCSSISINDNPEFERSSRLWCRELLALRAFVWIEWVILVVSLVLLLGYCVKQAKKGSRHVWSTPLAIYNPHMASPDTWNPNSRVFNHMSFSQSRDPNPYPFGTESAHQRRNPNTRSIMSQDSGPAIMGYQLDPFNVPKERPISLASSEEPAVQPTTWRAFAQHGFNDTTRVKNQHAYSTSIDHHSHQAYAY
ncbi:hypothetical protein CPB86DRAFT_746444 [Serendipita vermifera]|nr:hypothetical protein CPB86DRAFT_746444 [Serendipita vermifera]